MSHLAFLFRLRTLGIHLTPMRAGQLAVDHRDDAITPAIREELRKRRAPLLRLLEARATAYAEWAAALKEISALWNHTKDRRGDAPFLSEEKDHQLTDEVTQAIKACDLPRARRAIHAWRGAWLRLLRPAGRDVDPDRAVWPAIENARRRAESTGDAREAWAATLKEVALWLRLPGALEAAQLREDLDQRLMSEIGAAIKAGDRTIAFLRIEEWREAWLGVLGQVDLASTGRLNVIDSFRRGRDRVTVLQRPREEARGRGTP